ncbi:tetratricopeptide repeat protein [Hyphomicrobiaceae bacterium 22]|uniref:Tetratricopeptide repeat protein n=2 Tax=Prosthecodimorpha staleyi TaxID=2840188 RepID=A0A947D7C8_9HYPH|nr:tetratricopeptide repeat protein [Prosthecodimorpha staleyi]
MLVRGEADGATPKPVASASEPTTTGSAATPVVVMDDAGAVAATGLTGASPVDPVSVGKRHFREGHFGLAEQSFRKAVELGPRDAEAWVGLAASYDRLRRFDLADRAYAQAIRLAGANPVILNNQGYSYLLRGDLVRARAKLAQARAKDAGNPVIAANLAALDESMKLGKDIR